MHEIQFLDKGWEHTVWKAHNLTTKREYVYKQPRPYIVFTLNRFFNGTERVKQELEQARKDALQFDVLIPRTRIIDLEKIDKGKGYVIAQEYIHNDDSVNISSFLKEKGADFLYLRYIATPTNFLSNNGSVYLLDFTQGIFRFTSRFDQQTISRVREVRQQLRNMLRR